MDERIEEREGRKKRCSHGGSGGKGERVFLNRMALAFCWLNGKMEERKQERNKGR